MGLNDINSLNDCGVLWAHMSWEWMHLAGSAKACHVRNGSSLIARLLSTPEEDKWSPGDTNLEEG